jgi:hypothetical protein
MRDRGLTRAEATAESVDGWMEIVRQSSVGLLSNEIDSWMTGVNRNVDGRGERRLARYSGTGPAYRAHCEAIAADGYRGIGFG